MSRGIDWITARLKCPHCGHRVAPVRVGRVATAAVDRACRYCRRRWRVIVRPSGPISTPQGAGFVHVVEWAPIETPVCGALIEDRRGLGTCRKAHGHDGLHDRRFS